MKRHIICERDVGLFSLVQQVIANIPWALQEGRIPIALFTHRTCYFTGSCYRGRDTVWEYYFEPIMAAHPVASIPQHLRTTISSRHPDPNAPGYFADEHTFVSNHFGDHPDLDGKTLVIPYLLDDPPIALRNAAHQIIRQFIVPREYVLRKAQRFFQQHLSRGDTIGVHVRGTDAISAREIRPHRQNSLSLSTYMAVIQELVEVRPQAKIFVATDDEASLIAVREAFGARVVAYDSIRHAGGDAAGSGPTGWIMPAYISADRDRAARNGEEAIVEYLLLSSCDYLVHNGSSLARTVLLNKPELMHTNTRRALQTLTHT
ncbi:MAG: O-fucosyltransferase family protein [Chloroflexota bacterium]